MLAVKSCMSTLLSVNRGLDSWLHMSNSQHLQKESISKMSSADKMANVRKQVKVQAVSQAVVSKSSFPQR